jgi:hypothetical protein
MRRTRAAKGLRNALVGAAIIAVIWVSTAVASFEWGKSHTKTVYIDVPGPTVEIPVPGPTVEVPGPTRIVKIPGRVVVKKVPAECPPALHVHRGF